MRHALWPKKYYSFKPKLFKFEETLYIAPVQSSDYESKTSICSQLDFSAFLSVLLGPKKLKMARILHSALCL